MALTDFGKAVRKARIDSGENMLTMANAIGTTPAFLSGMENGRKKIPEAWVEKIDKFFKDRGYPITNLAALAAASNGVADIDNLSFQQKMLVAGFAQSRFTDEQLTQIAEFLEKIKEAQDNEDSQSD